MAELHVEPRRRTGMYVVILLALIALAAIAYYLLYYRTGT
jgi:hypothetical protein